MAYSFQWTCSILHSSFMKLTQSHFIRSKDTPIIQQVTRVLGAVSGAGVKDQIWNQRCFQCSYHLRYKDFESSLQRWTYIFSYFTVYYWSLTVGNYKAVCLGERARTSEWVWFMFWLCWPAYVASILREVNVWIFETSLVYCLAYSRYCKIIVIFSFTLLKCIHLFMQIIAQILASYWGVINLILNPWKFKMHRRYLTAPEQLLLKK